VTAPDDRNPLARALDEAADGPEARAFSVSVEAVNTAVRRRRARRAGLTSGLAILVIAVIAGGAYAGVPGWGGTAPLGQGPVFPGPAGTSVAIADWPAQFQRCGKAVSDALPPVGGDVNLAVAGEPSSVATDGTWDASVVLDVPGAPRDSSAVVWGTDLSVVKDGVVVGVQDGTATPDLSLSLDERLGGNALPTSPFPVTTKVSRALVSCSQYPNAQGSPNLAPGTYQLVVTQTLSYATQPVDPAPVDVRASVTTTVTITAPEHPATADPTACGAPVDLIAALANRQSNPAPISLSTGFHPTPGPWYQGYPIMPRLTNDGTAALEGLASQPVVVAVRDGVVVGRAQSSGTRVDLGPIVPGGSHELNDPPLAERCPGVDEPAWGGTGLPAGDYDLWVFVDVSNADKGIYWQAAAGPISWTVSQPRTAPAVDPTTASATTTSAGPSSIATLTQCGAPADDLTTFADAPQAPYTAALNPHSTPYGYANIPASPALTPVPGRTNVHDVVDVADPVVVAIQGGTVVARSVVPNHPDAWTGALTITFPDPPALTRCPGVPIPADGGQGLQGDYVLRLVVSVTVTGTVPGTWLIAGAPRA